MTNENFERIAVSLNESSTHLQALREKYDGALNKLETKQNEALEALDAKKTEGVGALETKKSELESALSEEAKRIKEYTLSDNLIIKVGNGEGEKRTLHEAYNEALKYRSTFKDVKTQNKVSIEIQEGWEWNEPLGLYDMDLSGIILTQKNFDVPIMVNLENGVKDNGLNVLIYLDNSKMTIGRLHLKAKAHTLSNIWFHGMCYQRKNSSIMAIELKFDYSLVDRNEQSGEGYPLFVDDNSNLSLCKFTGILRNDKAIAGSGFQCADNSRAFVENLTLQGNCINNGVACTASSNMYILTMNLSGTYGHYGVACTASSNMYILTMNLSGTYGHYGVTCTASQFNSWGNNSNFSGASCVSGARFGVDNNGFIVVNNSCRNGGNFAKEANIALDTWTPQGVIRIV